MKIILTGASGFLGKAIQINLNEHEIITIARSNAQIKIDIAENIPQLPSADMVIHCAGKAHIIPKTNAEKQAFFNVNVNGTQNLLTALESASHLPKAFVLISTVAVYGRDYGIDIKEDMSLSATDPYGASKIQAEQLVSEWCKEKNVTCAILRLPLLIGPNPPGNLGAMINAIKKGYYFNIGGGGAKKSMVSINDVAKIIIKASEIGGIYNLTDGYHPSFAELSAAIAQLLKKKNPVNLPYFIAKMIAITGEAFGKGSPFNLSKLTKITSNLTFDDTKARQALGWAPTPVLSGLKSIDLL